MRRVWNPVLLALSLLIAVLVVSGQPSSATTASAGANPVGTITLTFVDHHRSTPSWGSSPRLPQRTLVTTIYYPAASGTVGGQAVASAPPDHQGAPYPLIVFGHGLDSSPQGYAPLLEQWAAAGFVVAAPEFPLTNSSVAGGPDEADVVNQPGDMSFVITSMLATSRKSSTPLSGLINPKEVGAAGHSNGAVTTLALATNSCCLDRRLRAAVILAGEPGSWSGHPEYAKAPPLMIVNGTADTFMTYSGAEGVYNAARGPKVLLTLPGGDHGSAAAASPVSAPYVVGSTIDFFDAYLKGSAGAKRHLVDNQKPGVATLHLALSSGSRTTIVTVPAPVYHRHASVSPQKNLRAGQDVTVSWHGYIPGQTVNIIECSKPAHGTSGGVANCGFKNALLLHPDPTGSGSVKMTIVTGAVGDGVCDSDHPCALTVNDGGSAAPGASVGFTLTFAK